MLWKFCAKYFHYIKSKAIDGYTYFPRLWESFWFSEWWLSRTNSVENRLQRTLRKYF